LFSIQEKFETRLEKHKTPLKSSRFSLFVLTQGATETIINIKPWELTK